MIVANWIRFPDKLRLPSTSSGATFIRCHDLVTAGCGRP